MSNFFMDSGDYIFSKKKLFSHRLNAVSMRISFIYGSTTLAQLSRLFITRTNEKKNIKMSNSLDSFQCSNKRSNLANVIDE